MDHFLLKWSIHFFQKWIFHFLKNGIFHFFRKIAVSLLRKRGSWFGKSTFSIFLDVVKSQDVSLLGGKNWSKCFLLPAINSFWRWLITSMFLTLCQKLEEWGRSIRPLNGKKVVEMMWFFHILIKNEMFRPRARRPKGRLWPPSGGKLSFKVQFLLNWKIFQIGKFE